MFINNNKHNQQRKQQRYSSLKTTQPHGEYTQNLKEQKFIFPVMLSKTILSRGITKQSCQVGKIKNIVYTLGDQIFLWAEAEII